MRRLFSYGLILLAALTGCRREAVPGAEPGGIPIAFSAGVAGQSSTKALPHDSDYLIADGKKIAVYGTWTSPQGVSTDVFSKIGVTCEEQEDASFKWIYSPLKYWRKGGQYQFSGIYPYDVTVQYGTSGNKLVTSYSMHANDFDLMVASAVRNLSEVDDTSPVDLTFHHAMTAVRFLFSKGSDVNHYYLNFFELQNLQAVGVLVYDGGVVELDDWNAAEFRSPTVLEWSASGDNRIWIPENYGDLSNADNSWKNWHFVIPQNLGQNGGYRPAVRFSVNINDETTDVYTTLDLPEVYDNGDDVVWEPGKMYTYYVQIQPSTAAITVKVTDWDSYFVGVDDLIFGE